MDHPGTHPHFRAWLAAAAAALTLMACGGSDTVSLTSTFGEDNAPAGALSPGQELATAFAATLSGAQEVPSNQSGASGSGTVVINPVTREMSATVTTTGIAGSAAHIHEASTGISGPIIFPLAETSPGSGVWTARAILTAAQFNTMKAGGFYFNVHSAAFPNGEIRGQITPQDTGGTAGGAAFDPAAALPTAFFGVLRGTQEVPPTPSAAQGAGALQTASATREVIAAVVTTGIAGTAAHIHQAAPGVNGPIIVPLAETLPGSGIWTARATLTEAQYSALQAGNLYFNVHSAAFPNGEIRGQIFGQRRAGANTATGVAPPALVPIGEEEMAFTGV